VATATAVAEATASLEDLAWMDRYLQSTGYKEEWGEPKTGGTLRWRMPRNPSNFTPSSGVQTTNGLYNIPPYNSLLRFDPWVGLGSIQPDLAKTWEWSSDSLVLTLTIEEGVKTQDNPIVPATYDGGTIGGDEITCEDVQASARWHILKPEGEVRNLSRGPQMLNNFTDASCPDGALGYTVELAFDTALAKTMPALAQGSMSILDKDYIAWLKTMSPDAMRGATTEHAMMQTGTGPFIPEDFQSEIVFKWTRNPTYWREGLPLVDRMEVFVIKDYTTGFTALATGQIHIFGRGSWALLPGQVAQAERDFPDRIIVHPAQHLFADGIQFYTKPGTFDDRRVRQAINLAIDRDEFLILNEAGSQPGRILMALLMPNSPWSFTEEEVRQMPGLRQPKDADIAEANRLMDEVYGAGERPTITCSTTAVADQTQICLFLGDQMQKNLDMTVEFSFAESVVNSQRNETCSVDMTAGSSGGSTRIGDPDDWFYASLHSRTALSPGNICRLGFLLDAEPVLYPDVLAQIDAQSVEIDAAKRKQMVQDLESEVFEELIPKIGFGWNLTFPATGPKVMGYNMFPLGVYNGASLWERMWLVD
jgi:ABC-type transport system substrate-binding protein